MVRRLLPILIFALAGSCIACDPPPPEPEHPLQKVGTVHLEGDSVTFQTYFGSGVPLQFSSASFEIGASATYAPFGYPAVERVPAMVAQGNVDTLIWALGLNDIFRDPNRYWSAKDQDIWLDLLMNELPVESCLVIIKPGVLEQGYSARPKESIDQLHAWIDALDDIRPNTVVMNWDPILRTHPHFSPKDGVHLEPGSGGAEARDAMYREGVDRCGIA